MLPCLLFMVPGIGSRFPYVPGGHSMRAERSLCSSTFYPRQGLLVYSPGHPNSSSALLRQTPKVERATRTTGALSLSGLETTELNVWPAEGQCSLQAMCSGPHVFLNRPGGTWFHRRPGGSQQAGKHEDGPLTLNTPSTCTNIHVPHE